MNADTKAQFLSAAKAFFRFWFLPVWVVAATVRLWDQVCLEGGFFGPKALLGRREDALAPPAPADVDFYGANGKTERAGLDNLTGAGKDGSSANSQQVKRGAG